MFKRFSLLLVVFVAVVAVLGFLKFRQIQGAKAMGALFAPPPTAVSTVVVEPQKWQPVLSSVGSLRAVNGVTLSTDLAGIVTKIAFESGAPIKKGDLLVELDTQQEQAQLESAQAKLEFANIDITRKQDLIQKKAISASDLDSAKTQLREAQAMVDEAKALIGRKRVAAPFDGVIGIRQVSLGQYLNPGAMIAPLQSVDPIYVEFSLPQQHLPHLGLGKKLQVKATGLEGTFEGEITAIDSRIDEATRNILIQGTIANGDGKLRPGMFVSVDLLLPEQGEVLAIPSSAISYAPYGDSVYVVQEGKDEKGEPLKNAKGEPQKTVRQQTVQLGTTRGDQVAVLKGLKPGEEVVSAGVFRLRGDAPVQINNKIQPDNELNPHPAES